MSVVGLRTCLRAFATVSHGTRVNIVACAVEEQTQMLDCSTDKSLNVNETMMKGFATQ